MNFESNIADFATKSQILEQSIKSIQDYPKKGILFRDITTLLQDAKAFSLSIDMLYDAFKDCRIDKIITAESRGFFFAAPLAKMLGCGLVPVRKPNKLPRATISEKYELEYGTNELHIHADAVSKGERILIIDDLLATGGTLEAMVKLARRLEAEIVSIACIIELFDLGGAKLLKDKYDVDCLTLVKLPGH